LAAIERLIASSNGTVTAAIGADLAKLEGTIARLEKQPDTAARSFDAEAKLLRRAHRYRDMGYALGRAAEAYLASGQAALAADRYFRAARSFAGNGDDAAAKSFLASSLAAAETAGDTNSRIRAKELLQELTRGAVP
jgi:hypothetical protein